MRVLISKVKVWIEKQPRFRDLFVLTLLLLFSLCASAQTIANDAITESMKQYLHALNGGEVSEEKLTKQLQFMQKVRNLWSREKFQELRHKSLKEILENEVGNSLFVSAVAFHEGMVKQAAMDLASYQIAQDKKEQVRNMITRAVQFRDGLRQYGEPRFKQIESLADENGWVTSVFMSPDGKYVSTRGDVSTLWSLDPKQKLRTQLLGFESVSYLGETAHSWDIRLQASVEFVDQEPICRIRNLMSGEHIATLRGTRHRGALASVSAATIFSPDSKILAWRYYTDHPVIDLWDVGTQKNIHTFIEDNPSPHTAMAFSPDNKVFATAGTGITLWDLSTFQKKSSLKGGIYEVVFLSFSPDGTLLASVSSNSALILWDVIHQRDIVGWPMMNRVNAIAFSPDGTFLAVATNEEIIFLDVKTKKEISRLEGINENDRKATFYSISFNADGSLLAAGTGHATLIFSNRTQVDPDLGLIYLADPEQREDR